MQTPWHYGWNVVGLTLVFQAITIGILIYCFALFVVPWLETFEVSRGRVMIAITALQLGMGALGPFAGRAMDALPIRWLVIMGVVAMTGGLLLVSITTAVWQIVLIYALVLPLGMALAGPLAAQTLVTRWFVEKRGMALGISAIGTSIGGFAFPFLTAFLIEDFGWRIAMQVLAVVTLLINVPLAFWILRREPVVEAASTESDVEPSASERANTQVWTVPAVLRAPMFWIAVFAFFPVNAAFGAVQFNLGAYVQDQGFPGSYAALLISLSSVLMIAGKFAFGAAADRVDHRYLYFVMAGGMGTSLLMLIGNPTLVTVILAVALAGFSGGGILTLLAVVFGSRFGAVSFGRVMGLASMFITLAAIGPLLSGWIHDLTGSYDLAFMLFAGLFVPSMLMAWRLPPPRV